MIKLPYKISLPIIFLKEGKSFVAYSPALDLSTAGNTLEQAKERFNEAVNLFFEEVIEKGTLDQILGELGWHKQNNSFSPPLVVSHQSESFLLKNFA